MLSPVRLSSVCNARAPYSGFKFSAIFLRHLVPWPSVHIGLHRKLYGDRPRGTPPPREFNTRGEPNIAILELSTAISRKRCKTGGKLVLITNRKSYYELSIGTKIGDLERRDGRYFMVALCNRETIYIFMLFLLLLFFLA